MTKSKDAATTPPLLSVRGDGRWVYYVLLGTQTLGAGIAYIYGLPLFRQTLAAPQAFEPQVGERGVWTLSAIVLMQTAYWISYRLRPPLPQAVNAFAGHVLQFFARMIFIFATSVYYFLFIARRPDEINIPSVGVVTTLVLLFSMFCYTLELEHLGKHLLGKRQVANRRRHRRHAKTDQ